MINPDQAVLFQKIKSKVNPQETNFIVKAMRQAQARLKAQQEANAAYQARCRLTTDEKRREAIDITAKNRAERNQVGFEQAKNEVTKLVLPAFNKQDDKK